MGNKRYTVDYIDKNGTVKLVGTDDIIYRTKDELPDTIKEGTMLLLNEGIAFIVENDIEVKHKIKELETKLFKKKQ